MPIEPIITVPHEVLRRVSQPVTEATPQLEGFLQSLGDTLRAQKNPTGVGLALPQIEHSWRAFATYLETSSSEEPILRFFVNPEILDRSEKLSLGVHPSNPDLEGCLSIPLLYAPVWRHEWITLQWQELVDGQMSDPQQETFYDFPARVIQHELDHLNGILFTDYLREQGQPLYRSQNKELVETDPIVIEAWS